MGKARGQGAQAGKQGARAENTSARVGHMGAQAENMSARVGHMGARARPGGHARRGARPDRMCEAWGRDWEGK